MYIYLYMYIYIYIYLSTYDRETPDETEIASLPSSVHPVLQQLVFACLRASPDERPSFKVISALMDLLFLQIHLINQDYLEMTKENNNNNSDDDNNNNNNNNNIQRVLKEKYGLNGELMEDILTFLSSKQPLQGKAIPSSIIISALGKPHPPSNAFY